MLSNIIQIHELVSLSRQPICSIHYEIYDCFGTIFKTMLKGFDGLTYGTQPNTNLLGSNGETFIIKGWPNERCNLQRRLKVLPQMIDDYFGLVFFLIQLLDEDDNSTLLKL